jgi:hypothetical protein
VHRFRLHVVTGTRFRSLLRLPHSAPQGVKAVTLLELARAAVSPLQCGSQSAHMRTTPSASHRGTDSTLAATTGSHSLRLMQPPLGGTSPASFGGSHMLSCAPTPVRHDLPKVREPRRESPGTPLPGGSPHECLKWRDSSASKSDVRVNWVSYVTSPMSAILHLPCQRCYISHVTSC